MDLKVFGEDDAERWNHILDNSTGATVFHRWEWLKIAEEHSRSRLYPLVYFDDGGHPFGIFPLFHSRRGPLKMVFSPPPGCAMRLGPIIVAGEVKQHRLEHLYNDFQSRVDDFIRRLGANYVFIATSRGLQDVRPFMWSDYDVDPEYTYSVDLTRGIDAVWSSFKQELRKAINRTERRGVTVEERASDEDIEYLYESQRQRYGAQNLRFGISRQYLYDVFRQFRSSNVRLFVALYEGRIVGALLHTVYGHSVAAWIGSSKIDIKGLAVNDLIQWEAIRWAIGSGYKEYEIMGANIPRLCEFKSRYSPELDVLFVIRKADILGKLAEKFYSDIYRRIRLRNSS